MGSWKTGEYADPILPEGNAIFSILSAKLDETQGGTPFVRIMARVDEFLSEYEEGDTVLPPLGQSAWGQIYLPKKADSREKVLGKQRRTRGFMQVMEYAGVSIADTDVSPVEVLIDNINQLPGKRFRGQISHSVATEQYPSKAEINFFQVRRA